MGSRLIGRSLEDFKGLGHEIRDECCLTCEHVKVYVTPQKKLFRLTGFCKHHRVFGGVLYKCRDYKKKNFQHKEKISVVMTLDTILNMRRKLVRALTLERKLKALARKQVVWVKMLEESIP